MLPSAHLHVVAFGMYCTLKYAGVKVYVKHFVTCLTTLVKVAPLKTVKAAC